MLHQDFNIVTFNSRPTASAKAASVKAAQRSGDVLTERRSKQATTAAGVSVAKLDGAI